jgi:hypothetical protein
MPIGFSSFSDDGFSLKEENMRTLLMQVLDDATGDIEGEKRVWPIRAELYRQIVAEIGYEYNKERAMKRQREHEKCKPSID